MGRTLATPSTLREQVADVLDAQTPSVVDHWLECLPVVTPSLTGELSLQDMQDAAPAIVHGVAEALRAGQPEALGAASAQPAHDHAGLRREGEALGDLLREFQVLHEEIGAALARACS